MRDRILWAVVGIVLFLVLATAVVASAGVCSISGSQSSTGPGTECTPESVPVADEEGNPWVAGVTATNGTETGYVEISWTPAYAGTVDYYLLQRRVEGIDPYVTIQTPVAGDYQDSVDDLAPPAPNVRYEYRMAAVHGSTQTAASDADVGYLQQAPATSVSATEGIHLTDIVITWSGAAGATQCDLWEDGAEAITSFTSGSAFTGTQATVHSFLVKCKNTADTTLRWDALESADTGYLQAPAPVVEIDGGNTIRVAVAGVGTTDATTMDVLRDTAADGLTAVLIREDVIASAYGTISIFDQAAASLVAPSHGVVYYWFAREKNAADTAGGVLSITDDPILNQYALETEQVTGLSATTNLDTGIVVTWAPIESDDDEEYDIYRSTTNVFPGGAPLDTDVTSPYSDTDVALVADQPEYYFLVAREPAVIAAGFYTAGGAESLSTSGVMPAAPVAPDPGRPAASLNGLVIASDPDRVPQWWAAPQVDTSGWAEMDIDDAGDMTAAGCDGQEVSTGGLAAALQCAVNGVSAQTVINIPADHGFTYSAGENLVMKSEVYIQGAGMTNTTITGTSPWYWHAGSCKSYSWIVFNGTWGSSTGWIGNFARGTVTLSVVDASIFTGDGTEYAIIHMDNDDSVLDTSQTSTGNWLWNHTVKIASVDTDANTVTLDRPLRLDYNTVDTANNTITKIIPVTNAGIGDLKLAKVGSGTSSKASARHVCMKRATENSLDNIDFDNTWENSITFETGAARNLVAGSYFHDLEDDAPTSAARANNYMIKATKAATDNHFHDLRFYKAHTSMVFQLGAAGNIASYTYSETCDGYQRATFLHGEYPSENLFEGNVTNNCFLDTDNYWGRQGPRNTFFRNRTIGYNGININNIGADPVASYTNYILNRSFNYVDYVYCPNGGGGGGQVWYDTGTCWAPDDGYATVDSKYGWWENNLAWDTRTTGATCVGDDDPSFCCSGAGTGGCMFSWGKAHTTGTAAPNINAPFSTVHDNYVGTVAPDIVGWNDKVFPTSLIEEWNTAIDSDSARPPGWCLEYGATWPIVGADVDDGSTDISIPAQIRQAPGTCTLPWVFP